MNETGPKVESPESRDWYRTGTRGLSDVPFQSKMLRGEAAFQHLPLTSTS
jgi:hypothetical protein